MLLATESEYKKAPGRRKNMNQKNPTNPIIRTLRTLILVKTFIKTQHHPACTILISKKRKGHLRKVCPNAAGYVISINALTRNKITPRLRFF